MTADLPIDPPSQAPAVEPPMALPELPPASGPVASAAARNWTLWVGLLGAIALLVGALLWQKVNNMQEQLARQSADAQAQSLEARALAKQAVALAQEPATRAAVME